ncbi:bifunctional diaminohydroxyphosphoribosylaminopyrimidine deaminase/5-amino-6-(5-phosphoribosylamino)uracil reductase RibD [Brevibacterium ravenspurgense]|uniref:Riboflavin biosynthesis protein RibD n=1 Tax=Brevibacterium ravenspurgense TaxID=479117 RepID=A0A2I1II70_9MICO|nr:bifunctional diaminohydroxyphosphoribosylaminopyrimidine deaminase/5-amino-6-(5-phosphoribosylamino)uracil reductase RibD [Brevibacterium ravenspurgense]PKY70825.1 bifunctional diaminohydroxyphosphoribosylaminopyrimidine deaminase/5-amino-6-(5-phosphoribosylamino)uracil reductase RibD [Brevibacterium ravenspurgense]
MEVQAAFLLPDATGLTHEQAMRAALEYAAHGSRGATPLVGAVLLPPGSGPIVGFHAGAGTAHAEAAALGFAQANGVDTVGATMVVTLEPCSHTGRTGPCTQRIIDAGITHAVIATADPNPAARGGADVLRAAGIAVTTGVLAGKAEALNSRWLLAVREGRPFITCKIAQSLDGCSAAADGTSQWITGEEARSHAHGIRAKVDAIAVGTGTALADNPRLSARPETAAVTSQPIPVVIGRRPLPPESNLAQNPRTITAETIDEALTKLKAAGVEHLLVEGGPRLVSSFIGRGLADELLVYQAPVLLGDGLRSTTGLNVTTLLDAHAFTLDPASAAHPNPQVLGADVLLRLTPAEKGHHVHRNH